METDAAVAAVRALQAPLGLLTLLHLTGPLWPKDAKVENCTAFDYIIVGAGTAGSVLAYRLTEDKETTVLLIEAGGDPNTEALLAGLFFAQPRTSRDWNYTSIFDDYAAKGSNNYTTITAGKMLGGSSSLNHLIASRGSQADYNYWAKVTNDTTWNYENCLPYFIKSERVDDDEILDFDGEYHGVDGPVGLTRELNNGTQKYLDAFKELGNNILPDLNGNVTLGVVQSLFTIANGVRQSTAFSYLRPIRRRKNLYVLKFTLATKIIFYRNTACAVETRDKFGNNLVYRARKEVIVSAGVFNTPQLLMLSGIGPKDHLKSMNICVRADLPVGNNLQDHVSSSIIHKMEKSIAIPPIPPLTQLAFPILTGLFTLNKSSTIADYQTYAALLPHDTPYIILLCGFIFAYRSELCDTINNDSIGRDTMYTLLVILQPESRGTVRLASTHPTDPPKITTGYYTNSKDLVKMAKYIQDYINIGNSTYFKSVNAELADLKLEACRKFKYGSQKYWQCYAQNTVTSSYHFTSTCPMNSVVDSKLKVYGFKRLRIVDASVMPTITRGNPELAVLMIAEKAADMIKADAKNLEESKCCACT